MVRLLSERMRLDDEAETPVGLTNQLAARAEHDTADRLGSIACPTLVCGGRFDGIAPPANSEFLARAIPGARLEMFDGGHGFFMQDAAALPAIVSFLAEDAPDARRAVDCRHGPESDTRVEGPGGALRRDLQAASARALHRRPGADRRLTAARPTSFSTTRSSG